MATNKNFEVKNGLTIAGTERISSAGAFTGSLASATTATTQSATDNSTKIATTAYTDAAITAVIGGAPGTLDTLNELAAAINDDASYASTLTSALATKLPLAGGTMSGNLAITKASPKISMTSTGSGNDSELYFQTASNGRGIYLDDSDSNKLKIYDGSGKGTAGEVVIDNTGRVGIGTSSPDYQLDVSHGTAAQYIATFQNTANNNQLKIGNQAQGYLNIQGARVDNGNAYNFSLQADGGNVGIGTATPDSPLEISSADDTRLKITDTGDSSELMFRSDGVNTQIYTNTAHDLGIYTNGNVGQIHLKQSNGNVGIGTSSPGADLHISGNRDRTCIIERNNGSTPANLAEMLTHQALTIFNRTGGSYLNFGGNSSYSVIQAQLNSSTAEDIILNPYGGRVGIGTTSAGAKLEISGKDDAGASDLLRLQFDNSPADTGITFTDINSTVKNRITMDASNTSDLHISASTEMKFFLGTTGTSTTQVMHLKKINSTVNTCHAGYGVIGPSSDITVRAQGAGENWRWGSNVSNSHSYWLNSSNVGMYMASGHNYWTAHSDERIKENITPLGEVLPSLKNMRCVKFNRKGSAITQIGFIAQDWEGKGFDEVVDEDTGFTIQDDGTLKSVVEEDNTSTSKPKSLAYTETIPLLLKAIQELEARITTLEG